MRRKVAYGFSLVMTCLLFLLHMGLIPAFSALQIGVLDSDHLLVLIVAVSTAVIIALCLSRKRREQTPSGKLASVGGWICTFCGAVITLSVLMDLLSWLTYGQIPPPNTSILNTTDLVTLICTLVFGLVGGLYFVWQGFCWMSRAKHPTVLQRWLALTPVLWMWFRLARYEISYASTTDIGESFFDFAVLIFCVLFMLEFARAINAKGVAGSGLLIWSLCTVMISLSGSLGTVFTLSSGEPLGKLLIAIVDAVIGLFALFVATQQVFFAKEVLPAADTDEGENDAQSASEQDIGAPVSDDTPEPLSDDLAWSELPPKQPPLEPPFSIDEVMPTAQAIKEPKSVTKTESVTENTSAAFPTAEIATPKSDLPNKPLTVDDLLNEIDNL